MSVSSPSAPPTLGHGKSLAERFGVELKSKTSWADMEDSDEEDSAVPVFTHQAPTNASKTTTAATPAPIAAAPTPAVVKAAPRGWGKPDAAATKVTETVTLTTPSKSNSSTSANNTSPTSTTAFTSPVTSTATTTKSAHIPAPSKQPKALPTFKTWGELTSSLAPKPTSVPAVPQPKVAELPSGLAAEDADDEEEEEEQKETTTAKATAVAFDPELDSSRDGLPLLFKGLTKAPVASELNVVMEEEIMSKSRQGTKRKEMEPETDANAAPVDMQALVAGLKNQATAASATAAAKPAAWGGAGLKQPTTTTAAATPAAEEREVQQPATGKKMKQADGTAKNVEPTESKKKESAPKAAPSSFLAAVTGTSSMEVESTEAAAAPAPTSAADLAKRIKQRQKQVDLGKSTPEYQNYLRLVPLSERLPHHPRTPNIKRDIPKRSMDGQLKVWRRALHAWDPEVMKAKEEGREVSSSAMIGEADAQQEEEDDGEMIDHSEQASEDGFVILQ